MSMLEDRYPGYHALSRRSVAAYLRYCTFVIDTTVFLNLYAYPTDVRDELLAVLKRHADRIWLPDQVVLEYVRNRAARAKKQEKLSMRVREHIKKAINGIRRLSAELVRLGAERQHPFLDLSEIASALESSTAEVLAELEQQERDYIKILENDPVRDLIDTTLSGSVGKPFSIDDLPGIYDEIDNRYARKQPPGFRDEKGKEGIEKYGDALIWRQMLDYAKQSDRSVFLVTDDAKPDWWDHTGNTEGGPRPELVQEMMQVSGVRFHIMRSAEFYEWARKRNPDEVSQEAVSMTRTPAGLWTDVIAASQRQLQDAVSSISPQIFSKAIRDATSFKEIVDANTEVLRGHWEQIAGMLPQLDIYFRQLGIDRPAGPDDVDSEEQ